MTLDIERLLAEACDDHDRPLRHSVDEVVRRGRRRARVRRTGEVAAGTVLAGAVVTGFVTLNGGGEVQPAGPATGSTPTTAPEPRPSKVVPVRQADQPPADPVSDDEVRRRCAPLDSDSLRGTPNKAGGGTDPVRNWRVVLSHGRDRWFQAILVSPDGKRYAFCEENAGQGEPYDGLMRQAAALTRGYKAYVTNSGASGPLPAPVARLTFRTPDGRVSEARIVDGYYLWYSNLRWVDLGRRPVWATFYAADGRVLARFNANPEVPELTPR
jgi:hypothetical protein